MENEFSEEQIEKLKNLFRRKTKEGRDFIAEKLKSIPEKSDDVKELTKIISHTDFGCQRKTVVELVQQIIKVCTKSEVDLSTDSKNGPNHGYYNAGFLYSIVKYSGTVYIRLWRSELYSVNGQRSFTDMEWEAHELEYASEEEVEKFLNEYPFKTSNHKNSLLPPILEVL